MCSVANTIFSAELGTVFSAKLEWMAVWDMNKYTSKSCRQKTKEMATGVTPWSCQTAFCMFFSKNTNTWQLKYIEFLRTHKYTWNVSGKTRRTVATGVTMILSRNEWMSCVLQQMTWTQQCVLLNTKIHTSNICRHNIRDSKTGVTRAEHKNAADIWKHSSGVTWVSCGMTWLLTMLCYCKICNMKPVSVVHLTLHKSHVSWEMKTCLLRSCYSLYSFGHKLCPMDIWLMALKLIEEWFAAGLATVMCCSCFMLVMPAISSSCLLMCKYMCSPWTCKGPQRCGVSVQYDTPSWLCEPFTNLVLYIVRVLPLAYCEDWRHSWAAVVLGTGSTKKAVLQAWLPHASSLSNMHFASCTFWVDYPWHKSTAESTLPSIVHNNITIVHNNITNVLQFTVNWFLLFGNWLVFAYMHWVVLHWRPSPWCWSTGTAVLSWQ